MLILVVFSYQVECFLVIQVRFDIGLNHDNASIVLLDEGFQGLARFYSDIVFIYSQLLPYSHPNLQQFIQLAHTAIPAFIPLQRNSSQLRVCIVQIDSGQLKDQRLKGHCNWQCLFFELEVSGLQGNCIKQTLFFIDDSYIKELGGYVFNFVLIVEVFIDNWVEYSLNLVQNLFIA